MGLWVTKGQGALSTGGDKWLRVCAKLSYHFVYKAQLIYDSNSNLRFNIKLGANTMTKKNVFSTLEASAVRKSKATVTRIRLYSHYAALPKNRSKSA